MTTVTESSHSLLIPADHVQLEGDLTLPEQPRGLVIFAHGSGSSRLSSRNRFVARQLNAAGHATFLMDLLTRREEQVDQHTGHLRFDIALLARRLVAAMQSLSVDPRTMNLPIGLFGASTGGGAALVAAARRPEWVQAVVSRGGRPDLAGPAALAAVRAPTLLIVGGADEPVLSWNREALQMLGAPARRLVVVPGAGHLFEEPGKLEEVARLAADWFARHLHVAVPAGMGGSPLPFKP